jgi:hypothetical protein
VLSRSWLLLFVLVGRKRQRTTAHQQQQQRRTLDACTIHHHQHQNNNTLREREPSLKSFSVYFIQRRSFFGHKHFFFDFLLDENKPNILLHHGHYRIFSLATTTTTQQ